MGHRGGLAPRRTRTHARSSGKRGRVRRARRLHGPTGVLATCDRTRPRRALGRQRAGAGTSGDPGTICGGGPGARSRRRAPPAGAARPTWALSRDERRRRGRRRPRTRRGTDRRGGTPARIRPRPAGPGPAARGAHPRRAGRRRRGPGDRAVLADDRGDLGRPELQAAARGPRPCAPRPSPASTSWRTRCPTSRCRTRADGERR